MKYLFPLLIKELGEWKQSPELFWKIEFRKTLSKQQLKVDLKLKFSEMQTILQALK